MVVKRAVVAALLLGLGFVGGWQVERWRAMPEATDQTGPVVMPFDGWNGPVEWTPSNPPPDAVEVEVGKQRQALESLAGENQALATENEVLREGGRELAEENGVLRARVAALEREAVDRQAQVVEFAEAAAMEKVNADLMRAQLERRLSAPVVRQQDLPAKGLVLADVNREAGLVALEAGLTDGVRVGMRFHVLRDDRRVAGITVVDVREHLAAAELDDVNGEGPKAGDRAVAMKASAP